MDYKAYFTPWAAKTNSFLDQFFQQRIKKTKNTTRIAAEAYKQLETFITGGKRIRAGLVKLGYQSAGGRQSLELLPVSAAIEITNGAILIHDDIIDRSDLRHNRPTVHKNYEAFHKRHYQKGDPLHYGESMAICVGDTGFYDAIELISTSKFPYKARLAAVELFCQAMKQTSYGELLDVDLAYRNSVSEKDVWLVNRLKTAYYTLVGPLQIGATLANAKPHHLKSLENYGIPLGIAFQLQDDILGMFGDVAKLGKPVDSDIKEGKNTILNTQALKRVGLKERNKLIAMWGNKNITNSQVEEVKAIIAESGAVEYCRKAAKRLVQQSKSAIPKITKDKQLQEVFVTLADFIVQREH